MPDSAKKHTGSGLGFEPTSHFLHLIAKYSSQLLFGGCVFCSNPATSHYALFYQGEQNSKLDISTDFTEKVAAISLWLEADTNRTTETTELDLSDRTIIQDSDRRI